MLLHGTEPVVLGARAVALLRALVERPGTLVSKDALIEAAWLGQAVEDSNLSVQIAALRRALGEAPGGSHWIGPLPARAARSRAHRRRAAAARGTSHAREPTAAEGIGNG